MFIGGREHPLPKYLDYCAIAFKIIHKRMDKDVAQRIMEIFYGTRNTMMEAAIFNDPEMLSQFDKYHIAIYEADELEFFKKPQWLTNSQNMYVPSNHYSVILDFMHFFYF